MAHVDIRIHFTEETEDGDTFYDWDRVETLENTIPEESRLGVTETLAQSDFGWTDLPNEIIEALERD